MSSVTPEDKYGLRLHSLSLPSLEQGEETLSPEHTQTDPEDKELVEALGVADSLVGLALEGEAIGLDAVLSRGDVVDVYQKILEYLGSPEDVMKALEAGVRPEGYEYYIGRLATYFGATDDSVTTSFGEFERRHTDRKSNAPRGPMEHNSRNYAEISNGLILRQLVKHYNAQLEITLRGPTRPEDGRVKVWKRGVAECQFIILDKIRDVYASGDTGYADPTDTLSIDQIGEDIGALLTSRAQLIKALKAENPLIADQVDGSIGTLAEMTLHGFTRGRRASEPMFQRDPAPARRLLKRVAELLELSTGSSSVTQEDVVALDFEDL